MTEAPPTRPFVGVVYRAHNPRWAFAPGTTRTERNLVLWLWSDAPPCQARVIDDFGRLPKDDASWA